MKKYITIFLILATIHCLHAQIAGHWEASTPMPEKLSNNAVAALTLNDTCYVFSFLGIDSTKIWSGITQNAYRLNTVTGVWKQIASVPGNVGRIAASAQAFRGEIYIFGGYSVAISGNETTWANVDIYDPVTDTYRSGANAPTPVDDQVTVVWRDSLIYNISGWSNTNNTKKVQAYNPVEDSWAQATPISGPGVFGHAGAIVGDTIVYIDGVRVSGFNFVMSTGSYLGVIDPDDPLNITWESLPNHPGNAKYRAAAGTFDQRAIFTGGTTNPYNFDGIGYNGQPANPADFTFGFNIKTVAWEIYTAADIATMDHRGLVRCNNRMYVVGGMIENQRVSNAVKIFVVDSVITGITDKADNLPKKFRLFQNFPNPFNPGTTIPYNLPQTAHVRVLILNTLGQKVRLLVNERQPAGNYSIQWDGTDEHGKNVSSGIYFYKFVTRSTKQIRKMILIR